MTRAQSSRYKFRRPMDAQEPEEKEPGNALALPMTIAELLEIRAQIIQSWKDRNAAQDRVGEAFGRIRDKDFFLDLYSADGRSRITEPDGQYDIPAMTAALDYSLFAFCLHKLNITQAMTQKAKEEFLRDIKEKKTVFNEQQLVGLAQNAGKLFRDSSLNTVRQVYDQLIGVGYHGGNWKTGKKDNLRKVEKVFRMGYSDVEIRHGHIELSYHRGSSPSSFHFNDLLTACRLIEGEGFTDYSNNFDSMLRSIPRHNRYTMDMPPAQTWVDTGYFHVQAYQNGNAKVRWNEEKIHVLEKLNAIGSGRSNDLPDTMRKRYKADHFHNGGIPEAEAYFVPKPDMVPNDEKDFAFFATQEAAAARLVELVEPYSDDGALVTLEPSAGDGGLLRLIPWEFGCTAVEFNHHRALKLQESAPAWHVIEADFLQWETDQKFDRVVMNPPFNDRVEAFHVIKAWSHLKPGGILGAILPDGWFTRDDMDSQIFRAFLRKHEYKPSEKLPAGSFRRTRVITRIVILRKPKENAEKEG